MIAAPPRLSVVLPTDTAHTIRGVMARLRAQTIHAEIEAVVVVPSAREAGFTTDDQSGLAVRIIEIGSPATLARARAEGVRAATAPLVFLGETHSYPAPGLAAALIAAAESGPWSVIVPRFANGNPNGLVSWVGFVADYGPWACGEEAVEVNVFPAFNAAYRREVLLDLGARLEAALGHGDELTRHLAARGGRALFAPAARIEHVNLARPAAWLEERYCVGRLVGANRADRWGRPRRLAYAAASPLIALVLARRALAHHRRLDDELALPGGTWAGVIAASAIRAAGEAVGYLFGGSRRAELAADELELHKLRYAARGG